MVKTGVLSALFLATVCISLMVSFGCFRPQHERVTLREFQQLKVQLDDVREKMQLAAVARTETGVWTAEHKRPTDRDGDSLCSCVPQPVLSQKVAHLRAATPFPTPLPPLPPAHKEDFDEVYALRKKKGFGGDASDDVHIGGWLTNDTNSWTPRYWDYLINTQRISSMIDVGCGAGIASKYFLDRGVDVRCVEGSNEAIRASNLPRNRIVQHDFTRGPWFPGPDVVDIAYSVEFMEHLNEEHLENVMTLFKSARYVVITASINEGWNHVNVHHKWWWVERFAAFGFEFSELMTDNIKRLVCNPKKYLHRTGMVFRNTEVDHSTAFREAGDMVTRRRQKIVEQKACIG